MKDEGCKGEDGEARGGEEGGGGGRRIEVREEYVFKTNNSCLNSLICWLSESTVCRIHVLSSVVGLCNVKSK